MEPYQPFQPDVSATETDPTSRLTACFTLLEAADSPLAYGQALQQAVAELNDLTRSGFETVVADSANQYGHLVEIDTETNGIAVTEDQARLLGLWGLAYAFRALRPAMSSGNRQADYEQAVVLTERAACIALSGTPLAEYMQSRWRQLRARQPEVPDLIERDRQAVLNKGSFIPWQTM